MAVLIGRYLNTLRTVVYEWDGETAGGPSYTPVIVVEPGLADGPITEFSLTDRYRHFLIGRPGER